MNQDYQNYYYQGYALFSQGNYYEAKKYFEKSIQANPRFSPAYNELGNIYKNSHDLATALHYYLKALNYMPRSAIILTNLGVTENQLGRTEKAREYFERAIASDPKCADAYYNLGKIYLAAEVWQEAKKCLQKAIKINPNFGYAQSLLAFTKMQTCDWDNPLQYNPLFDNPMLSVLRTEDQKVNYQVARYWSNLIENKMAGFPKFKHQARNGNQKITIGYASNDFYPHATVSLIAGLFRNHNKKKFNINIYSYGKDDNNIHIREFKKSVNLFRDISNISDFEAAKQIYFDKVDILVDLKGYSGGSRMEIFALRPAPIQITWLGFPGTTGSNFIDYILTDRIVSPKSDQKYFSEKFVYLPNSYQINDDQREIAKISLKRSDFGLAEDSFIFCSFNRPEKITPEAFDSWMRILKMVPKSILWLLKDNNLMVNNLKKEAVKRGIEDKRLVFAEPLEYSKHLKRFSLADLSLDTFIYNGHTTTSDSLWAGVPVVTLKGNHFASRVSASLLTAVGLPELITYSQKEYESLAVELATNPQKLNTLRSKLLSNRLTAPLFNTKLFVKNLEKEYIKMWENYKNGKI